MDKALWLYTFALFFESSSEATSDPCMDGNHKELHKGKYRGTMCHYNNRKPICDRNIEPGWYKVIGVNGLLKMPEVYVSVSNCGTNFPVWMNGSHPTEYDGIVEQVGCLADAFSPCSSTYEIGVKSCSTFYVYHLVPTLVCDAAYCFGLNEPCPTFDPCDEYEHTVLDNTNGDRSSLCPTVEDPTSDQQLEEGWQAIRSTNGFQVVSTWCPDHSSCGTKFPIWINGSIPTVQEDIVTRAACVRNESSCCAQTFDIKMKNCSTYVIYNLTRTQSDQRYCTDDKTECRDVITAVPTTTVTIENSTGETLIPGELPTFVPRKPAVFPVEVFKQAFLANISRVHFDCAFEPSTDPSEADLYYQVYWYATKDASEKRHVMSEQHKDNRKELQLTEEIFMNNMKQTLGVNISCAVLPLSGKQGIPGTLSQRSDPFFAGIHVNVIRSIITRGDNGNPGKVSLTSTIPLGCDGPYVCRRRILAYVPDKDKCNGPAFGKTCGTQIFSDRWNGSYEISIVAGNDAAYALRGKFDIYLKVESTQRARIWNNYHLPKFSVEIAESPLKDWQGKICYSHNDPHLKTFDGRSFENQIVGEYILYRHLDFITEVQIKTIECGGIWSSAARCNCGVAVKAGKDVFVLDVCGKRRFIGYQDNLCLESTLDVRKKGNTYTIYLPYGTYVTVSFWSHDTRYLSVDVTSSIHDDNLKSTGLCGAISKACTDDFRMRDGTFANENAVCETNPWLQPVSVINEWR